MAAKNLSADTTAVLDAVTAANEAAASAAADARKALEARLAEIDSERETLVEQLKSLGGSARKRTRKNAQRASNDVSLITAVATCLSKAKGPLTPTQVCENVIKAGYKTNSDNYPQMVSQALSTLKGLKMGVKSPVATNVVRGEWLAGSGMERYLANPEAAKEA